MGNVIKFYSNTAAKDPDVVLEQAIGEYESLIVIGYGHDDHMQVRASLNLNSAQINWLIDNFKQKLINGDYCDEENAE